MFLRIETFQHAWIPKVDLLVLVAYPQAYICSIQSMVAKQCADMI